MREVARQEFHPLNAQAFGKHRTQRDATPDDGSCWEVPEGAIIRSGLVELGVRPLGHLIVDGGCGSSGSQGGSTHWTYGTGLRFTPTNKEVLAWGWLSEGWGVGDAHTGTSGHTNYHPGTVNMSLETFSATATDAVSIVRVGSTFRVTHEFRLAGETPHLYEVRVTVENTSAAPVDLRYRRVMDWIIPEPLSGAQYLTIQGTQQDSTVLYAGNDGFAPADPFGPRAHPDYPVTPPMSGDFVDFGPTDQGTIFDFGFGELAPGATRTFSLFFGAAADEATALAALSAAGINVYSFAQPSDNPAGLTFMFGYRPAPSVDLTCTPNPVLRAHPDGTTCRIIGDGVEVHEWYFSASALVDTLRSASTEWAGKVVIAGEVSAKVTVGGDTLVVATELAVESRNWRWNAQYWSFVRDAAETCITQRLTVEDTLRLGRNVRRYAGCDDAGRIDPNVEDEQASLDGYTAAQVTDQGPNHGYWYVSEARWRMDRRSVINLELTESGPVYELPAGSADLVACQNALGSHITAVNQFTFNMACVAHSVYQQRFLAAVWAHEEFGTGSDNGHEARGRIGAAREEYDPHKATESIVWKDLAFLRHQVRSRVYQTDQALTDFSVDHNFVRNNWCGSVWVWSTADMEYQLIPIEAYDPALPTPYHCI